MTLHLTRDKKDIALTSINNYHCVVLWLLGCRRVRCLGRGDAGMDAESMRRERYGIFFGEKIVQTNLK